MTTLADFSEASLSPYKLALSRIHYLESNDNNGDGVRSGLAKHIVELLQVTLESRDCDASRLVAVLKTIEQVHVVDKTLAEEVARHEGFLACLLQIQHLTEETKEDEFLVETKQLSASILDTFSRLSSNKLPFSTIELQSRLPLVFAVPHHQNKEQLMKVLIQQPPVVEHEEEYKYHDVGLVMWPAAVTLARWVAMNPSIISRNAAKGGILEIGAGCGLVGLTAATMLHRQSEEDDPSRLYLTDYNPAVLENLERNIRLNEVADKCSVVGLDFFDQPEIHEHAKGWIDMNGQQRPQVGLILGADIICYSNDADLVCNTIHAALVEGGTAIVVTADSTKRFGVEGFPQACRNAGLQVEVTSLLADSKNTGMDGSNDKLSGEEKEAEAAALMHDLVQTCRFSLDYELLMFTIVKPISSNN